jgi:hypothetical protein
MESWKQDRHIISDVARCRAIIDTAPDRSGPPQHLTFAAQVPVQEFSQLFERTKRSSQKQLLLFEAFDIIVQVCSLCLQTLYSPRYPFPSDGYAEDKSDDKADQPFWGANYLEDFS